MSLNENLSQFHFDLETCDLFLSSGRSQTNLVCELSKLNLPEKVISLMLDNRLLLNRLLLRLQLYSDNNTNETLVREKFNKLNNDYVSHLLDYLYNSTVEVNDNVESENTNVEESSPTELDDTTSLLNNFFNECVVQTDESTDVVKSSEFYSKLTEWWNSDSEKRPEKKELKTYLNERLGKSKSNMWTNVYLN